MFSGIVEAIGEVVSIRDEGANRTFCMTAPFAHELKVDQSVAHNGVCLTVTRAEKNIYDVVAIQETLQRTNLGAWKCGDKVNLERSLRLGDRIDGHMVQGHVDGMVQCIRIEEQSGSWKLYFDKKKEHNNQIVAKGSVTLNGVSLTVVDDLPQMFSVCIIPYTYYHTVFQFIEINDRVNIEYDILGKYIQKFLNKN
jgi:riboflavin synthase